jgi:hypothetical protein
VYYNVTESRFQVTIVAVEKQKLLNIICACILTSVIQHETRMRHFILPFVGCLALQYFSTLPQRGTIFEKRK